MQARGITDSISRLKCARKKRFGAGSGRGASISGGQPPFQTASFRQNQTVRLLPCSITLN
ncbi:hypothetical protein HMPREF9120_00771 [Neisseria sp. oral taxon 020 str. F0370]|nr:hypothetical protein HMPREF9120_00771 [Neisseria sp. oral taxon 020 str. F0370]